MNPQLILLIWLILVANCGYAQSYSDLYRKCSPSVVVIETEEKRNDIGGFVSYNNSFGSGVLIDEEGNILTAAHVVDRANSIQVKFISGEIIPADLVRSTQVPDVALIKLRRMPEEYAVAKVADSDSVEIGDEVAVIGTPYGLEYSLSRGIISARHREKEKTTGLMFAEFFQTDAAINKGNSGGPMFNVEGEVIAIVSSILTESGGFQGVGFAATSNVCRNMVIDDKHERLGINGYWLNEEQCMILNVPQKRALLIQHVRENSPADLAGLNGGKTVINMFDEDLEVGGDIILAVNGVPIDSETSLVKVVFSLKNIERLDQISLKVLREGEIFEQEISFNEH